MGSTAGASGAVPDLVTATNPVGEAHARGGPMQLPLECFAGRRAGRWNSVHPPSQAVVGGGGRGAMIKRCTPICGCVASTLQCIRLLELNALPGKGRRNRAAREREEAEELAIRQHPAVESGSTRWSIAVSTGSAPTAPRASRGLRCLGEPAPPLLRRQFYDTSAPPIATNSGQPCVSVSIWESFPMLRVSSPHFSPGGAMIAQAFFLQRVLATASVAGTTFKGACARWREKDQRGRAQHRLCPRDFQ